LALIGVELGVWKRLKSGMLAEEEAAHKRRFEVQYEQMS
jgi:hypothetical protein